jgi:hypothetical protein
MSWLAEQVAERQATPTVTGRYTCLKTTRSGGNAPDRTFHESGVAAEKHNLLAPCRLHAISAPTPIDRPLYATGNFFDATFTPCRIVFN